MPLYINFYLHTPSDVDFVDDNLFQTCHPLHLCLRVLQQFSFLHVEQDFDVCESRGEEFGDKETKEALVVWRNWRFRENEHE